MKLPQILLIQTLLMAFLLLPSCKQEDKPKPKFVLSEEQMIEITTDIQLIEAALNYRRNIGLDFTETKEIYYGQLFEKYEITPAIYDQNVLYYNNNPERMEGIYNEVLNRLEQMQKTTEKESGK